MGNNKRKVTTTTRSLSFANDIFTLMEERRAELRMTRSEFINALLEHNLDILPHPEIADMARRAKIALKR